MPKKRQIVPQNTIGGRIDIIIDELHINSKKLADLINISEGLLSDIRHGKVELSKRVIKGITRWITIEGKSINKYWLLTGEGEMFEHKYPEMVSESQAFYEKTIILEELLKRVKVIYEKGDIEARTRMMGTIDEIYDKILREEKQAITKKEASVNEGEDVRDKAG
jgi:transcriptional regulator with XRE-family HTH domain